MGREPWLRAMSSAIRLTSAISTRLFIGFDGVLIKIIAMRPSARARSAAERIYCSSSPSVKATPFDAEGRKGVIGQAGKATIFGRSEDGSANIRCAHAVHPVSAPQSEYSAPSNGHLPHRYCDG
jgi:hypothetical protein